MVHSREGVIVETSSSNISFPVGIPANNVKYHPPNSIDMFLKSPRSETFIFSYSRKADDVEILDMMGSYQWQNSSFPRHQF